MRKEAVFAFMFVLLALPVSGGCDDSTAGEAKPGGIRTSSGPSDPSAGNASSSPSSGPSSTEKIPARPRDLDVAGIQPCALFTEAQLAQLRRQLNFDKAPRSYTSGDRYKAPTCGLEQSREPFNSVDLMLVANEGVEPWLSGERNVDAWVVSIGGYPAVDYKIKGSDDAECATSVDVAGGQQMIVDLIPLERVDYRQLCQITERVAGMALQTLQTLR